MRHVLHVMTVRAHQRCHPRGHLEEVGQRLTRLRALAALGEMADRRILQDKLRQVWADQLAAGVIATCPVVELEFLYSARSLADRLEKRRLLREVFGAVDERRVLRAHLSWLDEPGDQVGDPGRLPGAEAFVGRDADG
jgi:hypothetical protein